MEASLGLRGSLADKRGTTAGRRALALVADHSGDIPGLFLAAPGEETPDARSAEPVLPLRDSTAPLPPTPPTGPAGFTGPTAVTGRPAVAPPAHRGRGGLRGLARRNLVAAGAGALLVAVLGTVVTLGATSGNDPNAPSDTGRVNPTAEAGPGDDDLVGDTPGADTGAGDTGDAAGAPTDPGPDGAMGTSDDPTPTGTAEPSPSASSSQGAASPPARRSRPRRVRPPGPRPPRRRPHPRRLPPLPGRLLPRRRRPRPSTRPPGQHRPVDVDLGRRFRLRHPRRLGRHHRRAEPVGLPDLTPRHDEGAGPRGTRPLVVRPSQNSRSLSSSMPRMAS
ncbi:hypothetical protein L1856_31215 [Streptomyces sp. Tue 6430]|nr:hypothetical protein [Streptomyces sp. Tue 6430]